MNYKAPQDELELIKEDLRESGLDGLVTYVKEELPLAYRITKEETDEVGIMIDPTCQCPTNNNEYNSRTHDSFQYFSRYGLFHGPSECAWKNILDCKNLLGYREGH